MKIPRGAKLYPVSRLDKKKRPAKRRDTPKLRSALKPGCVVIILSGRFAGKRAVFLKQLESGLILITGPFKVNGVPLRRIPQTHVIPTSTTVELPGDIARDVKDALFIRSKGARAESEAEFMEAAPAKKALPQEFRAMQDRVDQHILGAIKPVPLMRAYLRAPFSLRRADRPHAMAF